MKLLFLLLALPLFCFGQNVNIPDANFKAYLVGNISINTNGDNQIQVSEASAFNGEIYCVYQNIYNLTGIEAFVSLTSLNCSYCPLTSLDVSTCTALIDLTCGGSQLTSLDVSTCSALTSLNCSYSPLTSLDASNCSALTNLYCDYNQLTSLDVSNCSALTVLGCTNNLLTSLDLSACTALTELYGGNNALTSLDLSNNTALTSLGCSGSSLTSLDVSGCTTLYYLSCSGNNLTSLDVKNGNNINMVYFNAEVNPNLSCIEVDNVAFSNANWSDDIDATASFSLNCSGAGFSDINESYSLMLYPNPTNGDFTITGLELLGIVSSLSLTDMNGKVVKVLDTKATKFSMGSIKPGVYFLNIISGNKQEVLKIVKE